MENLFVKFKEFADILTDFANKIEPICQKNLLTDIEGLTLLLIFLNNDNSRFCDSKTVEMLKSKGLLSENIQLSSKGAILAKSLSLTIERLKY